MKVVDIAKDIVHLSNKYGYQCNHTKIQKLLFLYVGFCLFNGTKAEEELSLIMDGKQVEMMAVVDEQPKAWPYGPVFVKVNNKYQEIETEGLAENYSLKVKDELSKLILAETVKKYGRVESGQLSEWLQKDGSPWKAVQTIDGTGWDVEIPLDLMREYFDNNLENIIHDKRLPVAHVVKKVVNDNI